MRFKSRYKKRDERYEYLDGQRSRELTNYLRWKA